jgi:hypothetical protein
MAAVVEAPDHLVADLDLALGRGEREIGHIHRPVRGHGRSGPGQREERGDR